MMVSAFIFVQLNLTGGATDVRSLHEALHAVPGVKTVHFVAGPTDVVVFLDVADQMELMKAVGNIRSTKGVASTDTRIVLPI